MPTDRWSIVLLVTAGYLAVMFLVRLMIRRRDHLVEKFRGEMEEAQRHKAAQERKAKSAGRAGKAA
jgi:type VI protein secretion system component VasK